MDKITEQDLITLRKAFAEGDGKPRYVCIGNAAFDAWNYPPKKINKQTWLAGKRKRA